VYQWLLTRPGQRLAQLVLALGSLSFAVSYVLMR
jgi:hypothetical protein